MLSAQKADQTSLADAWVSGNTYNPGDYVTYNGILYKCKTANSDTTFTIGNWDTIKLANETKDKTDELSISINKLNDVIYIKNPVTIHGENDNFVLNSNGTYSYSVGSKIVKYAIISGETYAITASGNWQFQSNDSVGSPVKVGDTSSGNAVVTAPNNANYLCVSGLSTDEFALYYITDQIVRIDRIEDFGGETRRKLQEQIEYHINLYNSADSLVGKYLDADIGSIRDDPSNTFMVTGYISCFGYNVMYSSAGQVGLSALYDADYNYIGYVNVSGGIIDLSSVENTPYYLRFTISKSFLNTLIVSPYNTSDGSDFPYINLNEDIKNVVFKKNIYIHNYEGKTLLLFGDSITMPRTGDGTEDGNGIACWVDTMKKFIPFNTIYNYATTAAKWKNFSDTEYTLTIYGVWNHNNVIWNQINRFVYDHSDVTPDVIGIFAGTNDICDPADGDNLWGDLDTLFSETDILSRPITEMTTVAKSVRFNIERLHSLYPNAQIIISTPAYCKQVDAITTDAKVIKCENFDEFMKKCATKMSVRCIDQLSYSGFNASNILEYTKEGTHPNVIGAKMLGTMIAREFDNILIV